MRRYPTFTIILLILIMWLGLVMLLRLSAGTPRDPLWITEDGRISYYPTAANPLKVCDSATGTRCLSVGTAPRYEFPAASLTTFGNCIVSDPQALVTNGPSVSTVINCTDIDTDGFELDFPWEAPTLTVTVEAHSIGNNNGEVFAMAFAGQCVGNGGTPTAHSTTGEQSASITFGNSANRVGVATTAAITLQGTCTTGTHVFLRGQVRASPTTFTPMTDLKILRIKVS